MTPSFADRTTESPPTAFLPRMARCLWRQGAHTAHCPDEPTLEGRRALVTGGARGIGLETSRGLAARGAELVVASRGEPAGKRAAEELQRDHGPRAAFAPLDLADLGSVPRALDAIETATGGAALDIVVANAGLWPTRHALSAQGHEIAFATNVLGHHALVRGLEERGLLAEDGRLVFVTGDIYILCSDCTPDYAYRGALGGQLAYCRSKLGNLWMAGELARRHPRWSVFAVHPGVVATELGGGGRLAVAAKRTMMISPAEGAQTSLFCATQPGLESGSYVHNTMGRMQLSAKDPGADRGKAARLFEQVDALVGEEASEAPR